MEFVATSKSVRISPRKVRLVADTVRNLSIKDALDRLSLIGKIASRPIEKTLLSVLANATHMVKDVKTTAKPDIDTLKIKSLEIFEGPSLKRFHPSTRGRIHPYKKRSSHIKIVLTDEKGTEYGTKS